MKEDEIPTTEQILKPYKKYHNLIHPTISINDVEKVMIKFAKIIKNAALEAAAKKSKTHFYTQEPDKELILNSFPDELIK